jgi:hypothetical protein
MEGPLQGFGDLGKSMDEHYDHVPKLFDTAIAQLDQISTDRVPKRTLEDDSSDSDLEGPSPKNASAYPESCAIFFTVTYRSVPVCIHCLVRSTTVLVAVRPQIRVPTIIFQFLSFFLIMRSSLSNEWNGVCTSCYRALGRVPTQHDRSLHCILYIIRAF